MAAAIQTLSIPGKMLQRGFWLYVWRVKTSVGEKFYVGRTGDSSSPHATAPYTRMGQHLGFSKASNSLRRLLLENNIIPEDCESFELISYGPIYSEVGLHPGEDREMQMQLHRPIRDKMAALEKKLRDALDAVGYEILNIVHSKKQLDEVLWAEVLDAFMEHFPKLIASDIGNE